MEHSSDFEANYSISCTMIPKLKKSNFLGF
jgi:hypothetical protein